MNSARFVGHFVVQDEGSRAFTILPWSSHYNPVQSTNNHCCHVFVTSGARSTKVPLTGHTNLIVSTITLTMITCHSAKVERLPLQAFPQSPCSFLHNPLQPSRSVLGAHLFRSTRHVTFARAHTNICIDIFVLSPARVFSQILLVQELFSLLQSRFLLSFPRTS